VILAGGCGTMRSWFKEPIPELATARAQYEYATGVVEMADPLPEDRSGNPWRTEMENPYFEVPPTRYSERDYRRFVEAFEGVVQRFPDDTEYTPNAMVRLGEFHHLLGEYGLAAGYYRDVLEAYPDDEVLSAASLFGIANVRLAQGQYSEAQRMFNRLVQRHGTSSNPDILQLCERASFRSFQLQHQMGR
jgi:outer membrane protein assembly factor BamD (BamD/ComL family)